MDLQLARRCRTMLKSANPVISESLGRKSSQRPRFQFAFAFPVHSGGRCSRCSNSFRAVPAIRRSICCVGAAIGAQIGAFRAQDARIARVAALRTQPSRQEYLDRGARLHISSSAARPMSPTRKSVRQPARFDRQGHGILHSQSGTRVSGEIIDEALTAAECSAIARRVTAGAVLASSTSSGSRWPCTSCHHLSNWRWRPRTYRRSPLAFSPDD